VTDEFSEWYTKASALYSRRIEAAFGQGSPPVESAERIMQQVMAWEASKGFQPGPWIEMNQLANGELDWEDFKEAVGGNPDALLVPRLISAPRTHNPERRRRGRPLSAHTVAIREAVLKVIDEYQLMTVRQVFYALEVRGVVAKDEKHGYKPVMMQVLKMRREGILPWAAISDASRWMRKPESYDSVEDALRAWTGGYRRNLWRAQGIRIEVWLEKDALAGVVMEETEEWDVPLMVSRGTSSATFLYYGAMQAKEAWERERIETYVFALYDYDAAGLRIARSVERGLREHAGPEVPIYFELLAVLPHQISTWNLPTRPPKKDDPEASKFQGQAVELDAIPPNILRQLVRDAIVALIDEDAWRIEQIVEQNEIELLTRLTEDWADSEPEP
jgi:hypothetical protein